MSANIPTLPKRWEKIQLPDKPTVIRCECGWEGSPQAFMRHVHWFAVIEGRA